MKKYILFIMGSFVLSSHAKIRLLTFHYNRPDFIKIQHKTFQKFLKNDYELIVFNDAPTQEGAAQIAATCAEYGIQCVRFQQEWHHKTFLTDSIEEWAKIPGVTGLRELNLLKGKHPSVRHCHVIQYALDNYGYNHDDILGVLDGDMFLIRPLDLRAYLENYDIAGISLTDETRTVEYVWPGIVFFDVRKLPQIETLRFNLSEIGNHFTDTGGHSHYYMQSHPTLRYKKHEKLNIQGLRKWHESKLRKEGFSKTEIQLIKTLPYDAEFHFNNYFLHYSRSSFVNEFNQYAPETLAYHNKKGSFIQTFIDKIIIE